LVQENAASKCAGVRQPASNMRSQVRVLQDAAASEQDSLAVLLLQQEAMACSRAAVLLLPHEIASLASLLVGRIMP